MKRLYFTTWGRVEASVDIVECATNACAADAIGGRIIHMEPTDEKTRVLIQFIESRLKSKNGGIPTMVLTGENWTAFVPDCPDWIEKLVYEEAQ